MSFYETYARFRDLEFDRILSSFQEQDIEQAFARESPGTDDFLAFLSPVAGKCLERMAEKAHGITLRHFGRTVQLYTPLYVSDYCDNRCLYCSFNAKNRFERKKLALEEVEQEAAAISSTGLSNILLLTGESRTHSPVSYIAGCVRILRKYFTAISLEIYPLTTDEYACLVAEGVDGLTIYQETYSEDTYRMIHEAGPKRDFRFRLEAPERGAGARMRQVNIGALLGLSDWKRDAFFAGLHAKYLQDRFPDVEIGVSVPRMRPYSGTFQASHTVNDRSLVQIILALRLFLPRLGISLSTREDPGFRENLLPLGITRMSAGSVTRVGGHSGEGYTDASLPQFEVADHRGIPETAAMIRGKGFDAVMKDWIPFA